MRKRLLQNLNHQTKRITEDLRGRTNPSTCHGQCERDCLYRIHNNPLGINFYPVQLQIAASADHLSPSCLKLQKQQSRHPQPHKNVPSVQQSVCTWMTVRPLNQVRPILKPGNRLCCPWLICLWAMMTTRNFSQVCHAQI